MNGPILPGAVIGVLGGGQLGRMMALAGRPMGYRFRFLDPDPECASRFLADSLVTAAFDDAEAITQLARGSDAVTIEIEKINPEGMKLAASRCPVRPSAEAVHIIQDRIRQKTWLAKNGIPLGPWKPVSSRDELEEALRQLGPSFVKAAHGGYDGRSQIEVNGPAGALDAWEALGGVPCAVEQSLDLCIELSVMVARTATGQMAVYPPALNQHENRILAWSVLPGPLPQPVAETAVEIAEDIAATLKIEGLLAVEMFLTSEGKVLVNELAPRPHNTFHSTEMACVTSQFEQAIRAVCGLPLGSTEVLRPAAIINLLGDLWLRSTPPAFEKALAIPGVRLNLYGKGPARPGRKMGHLTASAETPQLAIDRVLRAFRQLGGDAG